MKILAENLVLDTEYGENALVVLQFDRYVSTNHIALTVAAQRTGENYLTLTCNLDTELGEFEFAVKDWSENEGVSDWLVKNEIGRPANWKIRTGHVFAEVFELLPKYQAMIKEA
jgi:hypothetical protein